MIICTSISPSHINKLNQLEAVNSWKGIGSCFSLNSESEIKILQSEYDIDFIKTDRTMEHIVGKPLVNINAILDFAKEQKEDLLLINSDIIIKKLPKFKNDGITVLKRYDYTDTFDDGKLFLAGFDVYFLPKEFFNIFPQSVFSIGASWWDYVLLTHAIIKNIPVYYPSGKFAFHKLHQTQYSYQEWMKMGEYFRLEFSVGKQFSIPQIATNALNLINSKMIYL